MGCGKLQKVREREANIAEGGRGHGASVRREGAETFRRKARKML
jgi:hypothetical protein